MLSGINILKSEEEKELEEMAEQIVEQLEKQQVDLVEEGQTVDNDVIDEAQILDQMAEDIVAQLKEAKDDLPDEKEDRVDKVIEEIENTRVNLTKAIVSGDEAKAKKYLNKLVGLLSYGKSLVREALAGAVIEAKLKMLPPEEKIKLYEQAVMRLKEEKEVVSPYEVEEVFRKIVGEEVPFREIIGEKARESARALGRSAVRFGKDVAKGTGALFAEVFAGALSEAIPVSKERVSFFGGVKPVSQLSVAQQPVTFKIELKRNIAGVETRFAGEVSKRKLAEIMAQLREGDKLRVYSPIHKAWFTVVYKPGVGLKIERISSETLFSSTSAGKILGII